MAHLNGFNANEVEPTTPFEPLPAGKYLAAITASEMKITKKGDGSYLQLGFTVLDGDCKGRKVWDRLCINHPNDLTQKIARGNLCGVQYSDAVATIVHGEPECQMVEPMALPHAVTFSQPPWQAEPSPPPVGEA